eukprot:snap_masked-scaffold_29-processed-gene-0.28-mRNA-1 protein AED:1.00 eAED:1.00 QI:0/0/0/0/1/1/2/0/644
MLSNLKEISIMPGMRNISDKLHLEIENELRRSPHIFFFQITRFPYDFKIPYSASGMQFIQYFLQDFYQTTSKIMETKLVFLGEARSGKTATIRSLTGKKFMLETRSTPFLDLQYMVSVPEFQQVSRMDIIKERIKEKEHLNAIDFKDYREVFISKDQVRQKKSKGSLNLELGGSIAATIATNKTVYTFPFQDEIIDRVKGNYEVGSKFFYDESQNTSEKHFLRIFDFGGQKSFHCVHPIFLSDYGVYVVVFNGISFDKKTVESTRYWCESLIRSSPKSPVLFAATHWEKAESKKGKRIMKELNRSLKKMLKSLSGKLRNYTIDLDYFLPVENSQGPDSYYIQDLQNCIFQTLINEDITLSLKFKKQLTMAQILFITHMQENYKYIEYSVFLKLGEEAGLNENGVEELLIEYDSAGLIIYQPHVKNMNSQDNVIALNPSALASTLSNIIYDPELHVFAFKVSKNKFHKYRAMLKTGIMDRDLINDVLRNYSSEEIGFIISLALHLEILLKFPLEKTDDSQYLMPHMFPELSTEEKDRVQWNLLAPGDFSFKYPPHLSEKMFPVLVQLFLEQVPNPSFTRQNMMLRNNFCRINFSTSKSITLINKCRSGELVAFFHQPVNRCFLRQMCIAVKHLFLSNLRERNLSF